jgi:hypothetical protein
LAVIWKPAKGGETAVQLIDTITSANSHGCWQAKWRYRLIAVKKLTQLSLADVCGAIAQHSVFQLPLIDCAISNWLDSMAHGITVPTKKNKCALVTGPDRRSQWYRCGVHVKDCR